MHTYNSFATMSFIESIPGPIFLLVYVPFIAGAIFLHRLVLKWYYLKNYTLPDTNGLSPYEVALLREGPKSVVQVALVSLWTRKFISIKKRAQYIAIHPDRKNTKKLTEPVEQFVFEKVSKSTLYHHLFKSAFLKKIETYTVPYRERLRSLHLLPARKDFKIEMAAFTGSLLLVLLVGGIKIYYGIQNEQPVAFLFALMFVATIVFVAFFAPNKNEVSALGRHFVKKHKSQYNKEKIEMEKTEQFMPQEELMYAASFMGVGYLTGTPFVGPIASGGDPTPGSGLGCGGATSGCGGGGCGGGCGGCGG